MTVGELRKLLEGVEDEMPVVVPHDYYDMVYDAIGQCGVISAEGTNEGELQEFTQLDWMAEDSTEVLVFLISGLSHNE